MGVVFVEGVEIHFNPDSRLITWASDWLAIHDLAEKGLIERKFHRYCYGHVDFYVPKGR